MLPQCHGLQRMQKQMVRHLLPPNQQRSLSTDSPAILVGMPCLMTAFQGLLEHSSWEVGAALACRRTTAALPVQVLPGPAITTLTLIASALHSCGHVCCLHRECLGWL